MLHSRVLPDLGVPLMAFICIQRDYGSAVTVARRSTISLSESDRTPPGSDPSPLSVHFSLNDFHTNAVRSYVGISCVDPKVSVSRCHRGPCCALCSDCRAYAHCVGFCVCARAELS